VRAPDEKGGARARPFALPGFFVRPFQRNGVR
jgi:hypothetical protein